MNFNMLDAAPCGYLAFKDSGEIVWLNQTLSKWLGYSKEELTGNSIEKIFTLATRIFYNTHFFPLIKLHSRADEIFLSLNTKDKQDIPVLTNAERRIEDGQATVHCVFIRVHQRRKYEEEILRAKREAETALSENKQLQELKISLETHAHELENHLQQQIVVNDNLIQFNKVISHDLQEPLRKIQLYVDLVSKDSNELTPRSISAIGKIHAAAERLRTLTSGLRQYVNVNSEKVFTEVNLAGLVELARERAIEHRHFNDFDFSTETLPTIQGYRAQLEMLFFHLIDNAIQFRQQSQRLKIKIGCVHLEENRYRLTEGRYKFVPHIRITFEDNGIGFDPQYKDYIFELLKKIDPTTSGLGLGLSLVKKVVDNHHGSLKAESIQSKGTCFIINLPVEIV
jgi:sigma-B regulation protein RsbU (phosphoserine phosphatase)